jgi:imidazolonepropionase-like amidohydrolase
VQERELNILRRYKVTPISPTPILVASMISGWVIYMPIVVLLVFLSHFIYGMPLPGRIFSLFGLITLGVFAFRSIGLILASVANSMQGSQILIQLLYMPMLFLSGATFPVTMLPQWAQVISQFMPTSYLVTGFQGIFFRNESFLTNFSAVLALIGTMFLGTFISVQLFRWEKDEKISRAAMFWIVAVLCPFILLGSYQAYSRDHLRKARILQRDFERTGTLLIQGPRVVIGNGKSIESGAVLVKDGKIAEVFAELVAEPNSYRATVIEGFGKTLLPGLVDVHVHLGEPAGFPASVQDYNPRKDSLRSLAAYLYCGVTAVKSVSDSLEESLNIREAVAGGERSGSSFFICGPAFTAGRMHDTEFFGILAEPLGTQPVRPHTRIPSTAEEAHQQVRELKGVGVDGISGILDSGMMEAQVSREAGPVLEAIAQEARAQNLPLVIQTGNSQDIEDALKLGAQAVEHGSARNVIPEELLIQLAQSRVAYDPSLILLETLSKIPDQADEILGRSLVRQVVSSKYINSTLNGLASETIATKLRNSQKWAQEALPLAKQNLYRAYRAGVPLVVGTDSGNPFIFHGPSIHRELQLWIEAGIPPAVALQAATFGAAQLLRAENKIGLVVKGYEADLLLVEGNPLQDIRATERISLVIYKGERINRPKLFEQE